MPLVSVIMPVYNCEKYLAEAIDSILAQTFTDFELLIIDDASCDSSTDIIQTCAERDGRVKFFQCEVNRGSADARNVGLAVAVGEFIAWMDCDDVSLPQRFEKQVDYLRANPKVGAVGTRGLALSQDLQTTLFDIDVPLQHALIAMRFFFGMSLISASVMLRREFPTAVGGFEPGLRRAQDSELRMRLLLETPIRYANLPDRLYLYRRHEQSVYSQIRATGDTIGFDIRWRMFERLSGQASEDAAKRIHNLSWPLKLSFQERRATKRDLNGLIDALIARNRVDARDKSLMVAEMNRRLELTSPRIWQQFCHWRRHRFPRLYPDARQEPQ